MEPSRSFQTISSSSSTSENNPSETVWKIAISPKMGVPKALKRGQREAAIGHILPPMKRSRGLGRFSKWFLHALRCIRFVAAFHALGLVGEARGAFRRRGGRLRLRIR